MLRTVLMPARRPLPAPLDAAKLRALRILSPESAEIARIARKYRMTMADGLFYRDLREPFVSVNVGAVTLSTTDLALYPAANFPALGGQYWARPGKKMRIRLFGQMTTGTTPGNGTFDIYYGTGAAANGTIIASSATVALTASQTNISWMLDITITCRTTGATGTLFCTGMAWFNQAVLGTTLQPLMIPASAPVVSGSVDLTAANIISVQFKRSGSTAETMQVVEMEVEALN